MSEVDEKAGGRLQTNALFSVLNNLPEYRVDQQRSRRRPLNYLTRQYADAFVFEDAEDGNSYMSIREVAPQSTDPSADQPGDQPAVEEPAAEAPAVEPAPETEPAPEAKPEPAAPAEESDPTAVLVAAGFEEDVARQITAIFTESGSLRAAYNRLRTTFGSTTGREYYQRVKEIAGGAQ